MKFSEIEDKEQEKMLIGEKLQLISNMKQVEYQNSLVMKSLENYNSKYEIFKKEQAELLEKTGQKIEQLQDSNEIVIKNIKNYLESISHRLEKEVSSLNDNLDKAISSKMTEISQKSIEYIESIEELKTDAKKRFESYYERKKIIDILIYINLAITPILMAVLSYLLFIKK